MTSEEKLSGKRTFFSFMEVINHFRLENQNFGEKSTFFRNLPRKSIQIFEPVFTTPPQISNQIDSAVCVNTQMDVIMLVKYCQNAQMLCCDRC